MNRSTVPDFVTGTHRWECWVIGGNYVWKTTAGGLHAGRVEGCGEYWASANGRRLAGSYATLESAMEAAQAAPKRRAA
jgi:hypothetical protein